MLILPYKINNKGDIVFYLETTNHKARLYQQPTYLDAIMKTKLSDKLVLALLNTPPKKSRKYNYYQLIKLKISHLQSHEPLLEFINDNNKLKLLSNLKHFKNKLSLYTTIAITYPKFTENQIKQKDFRDNINFIIIPKNTTIYKAMPYSEYNTNNNRNPRALSSGWFSSLEVAKKYAITSNQPLKKKNIEATSPLYWRVYSFEFIKPAKLFYLMDFNNLHTIINKHKSQISNIIDKSTADYDSKKNISIINTERIDKVINKIKVIKMLTGFQATYKQQLNYIKEIHPVFKRKILQSEVEILDNFFNHEIKNRSKKVRYKIDNSYHSDLMYDLNRISIGTELDRSLLKILQETYKFDGYINHRVPSIWEFGRYSHDELSHTIPTLDEEIGLYVQRGTIKRKRTDVNDDRIFL